MEIVGADDEKKVTNDGCVNYNWLYLLLIK
jgi:hypothetical protein